MNTKLVFGVVVGFAVVVGIALVGVGGSGSKPENTETPSGALVRSTGSAKLAQGGGEQTPPSIHGSYLPYAPELVASRAVAGPVVLFFRASWCPTCRALDADIRSHLGSIPFNLTILDVDYDRSSELKVKYGVTYQHTLVEVQGTDAVLVKKWSGGQTLAALAAQVQ